MLKSAVSDELYRLADPLYCTTTITITSTIYYQYMHCQLLYNQPVVQITPGYVGSAKGV